MNTYTLEGLYENMPNDIKEIVSLDKTKKGLPVIYIGHYKRIFDNRHDAFKFLHAFKFGWITKKNR